MPKPDLKKLLDAIEEADRKLRAVASAIRRELSNTHRPRLNKKPKLRPCWKLALAQYESIHRSHPLKHLTYPEIHAILVGQKQNVPEHWQTFAQHVRAAKRLNR